MELLQKIKGSIFGMAIGDGFGYPTEFLSISEILAKWPPKGPQIPEGNPILVTDDTQMAISVADALIKSSHENYSIHSISKNLVSNYIMWLNDPKNNRAPGMTCIRAIENLEKGLNWNQATMKDSKGCGANMRVIPVGLLTAKGFTNMKLGAIAQFQSAITHSHPTALAASEITAITVSKLINGISQSELLESLIEYSNEQIGIYHKEYLGNIWDRPPFRSEIDFINHGWNEVKMVLTKIKGALKLNDKITDPCKLIGEGWIAEEAFGTALYCFLLYPNNTQKALRRAILTSGDSDSIACLAGAFSGANCGLNSLPLDWIERIEYKSELENIIKFYSEN